MFILLNVGVEASDISDCAIISSPGYYRLTGDILNSSEDVCIEIESSDVVFDGDGHVIDGTGSGWGIKITRNNVTIKNVQVKDWYYGIYIQSKDVYITNCSAFHNYFGLLSNIGDVNVSKCVFENNTDGVKLKQDNNVFSQNLVRMNKFDGVIVESSSNTAIKSNRIEENGRYGLLLFSSRYSKISNNSFVRDGIYIDGGNYDENYIHEVSNNTVNGKNLCYYNNGVGNLSNCGFIILVNTKADISNFNLSYSDIGFFSFNSLANLSSMIIKGNIYGLSLKKSVVNSSNLTLKTCDHAIYSDSESRINLTSAKIVGGDVYFGGDGNRIENLDFRDGEKFYMYSDRNVMKNVSVSNLTGSPSLHVFGDDNNLERITLTDSYSAAITGKNNVLSNIYLRNNTYGVQLQGENYTVENSTFVLNNHYGISIFSLNNASFENCTVYDHLRGIPIKYSSNIHLKYCDVSVGDYGIWVDSSDNIEIENSSIENFDTGIKSFKVNNFSIKRCFVNRSEYGIYLERTNATLLSSKISENNIGIFSLSSNLTAFNNKVCGNSKDFDSSDWMLSYGDNNSCNTPDGWNDIGDIGCSFSCFDCSRIDATYLQLNGEESYAHSSNKTFLIEEFKTTQGIFENGSVGFTDFRILKSEDRLDIFSSKLNLTYFNKKYDGILRGISDNTTFRGIIEGDITGRLYGSLNGTNFTFQIVVSRINDSISYFKIKSKTNLLLNKTETVEGNVSVRIMKYLGHACGYYDGALNLSEVRVEVRLNKSNEFNNSGYGIGSYYINDNEYSYFWIINRSKVSGFLSGRLLGILIGDFGGINNRVMLRGIVYRELVGRSAPLLFVEMSGPKRANPGGSFYYNIKLSNRGGATANNVRASVSLGNYLYYKGCNVEGIPPNRVSVDPFRGIFIKINYLNPGEEAHISVDVGVEDIKPPKNVKKIVITSKVLSDCNERTVYEEQIGKDIYLPDSIYVPPQPLYHEIINLSDSLFMRDDRFWELNAWLNEQNFQLLTMVERVYFDSGNFSDIAIFARDDGEFVLCFKADNGYPVLANYSENENRIRYFNDTGGFIYDLTNGTIEYYGTWKPHSPTFGDCFGNCLESKYGVLTFKSYYEWAKTVLKLATLSSKDILKGVAKAILTPMGVIKHGKVCYTCLSSNWSTNTDTVLSNCHDCFMATNLLSGLLGPYYDISACALDCKMDTWSHSCQEGSYMARCSKNSISAYLSTGITADLYPNKQIIFQCVDGKWKHIDDISCDAGETCMDIPGKAHHNAWCVHVDQYGAMIGNPSFAVWSTEIMFAHDPNAKYVNKKAVNPGDWINYTVEFENTGNGTAYGVYVEDTLSEYLNDSSLLIGPMLDYNGSLITSGSYDQLTRKITWDVGMVKPKSGGKAEIRVRVKENIQDSIDIYNYATVHFPNVFEITTTNTTITKVCVSPYQYILNNTCVNCTSDSDCGLNEFCNESHMCEKVNSLPIARAQFKNVAYVGENVTFDATKSYDPDGDRITCYWNFGDGSFSVGKVVKHSYKSQGIYNVTLAVVDERGGMNFTSASITIQSFEKPVALFTYSPSIPWKGEIILFNATQSYDPDGSIANYTWDFGDGNITITNQPIIVHFYSDVGEYVVNLTVSDDTGLTNFTKRILNVTVKGDFSGNGDVDIADVSYVAYMVIDKIKPDLRADFNNNGRVDVGDLAKIAYYLLGKINEL